MPDLPDEQEPEPEEPPNETVAGAGHASGDGEAPSP